MEYLHACPVCSHTDLRHYCRVRSLYRAGEFIRYERCRGCGTVVRNPRVAPQERLEAYEEMALAEEDTVLHEKSQVHYWHMLNELRRHLPLDTHSRLLDFGCGTGGFLVEAKRMGFAPFGLELSREFARHVEATHGIPVHQGLISDPDFSDERFHVIVTSQVFEHLLDPRETLLALREHLQAPGLLLVEVPNLADIRERLRPGALMDDSHLFYFSAQSLSTMLRYSGFQVLDVQQGLRPYRFAGARGRRLSRLLTRTGERIASFARVRTGLSVIAKMTESAR